MEEEYGNSERHVGIKLAPFNPSSSVVIDKALHFLKLDDGQGEGTLYDLGCGDGRILFEACKRNHALTAVGIEYDKTFVDKARKLASDFGLNQRVKIVHGNVMDHDFSSASAIFVYLVPDGLRALASRLKDCLERGVPIISYVFSIPGLVPVQVEDYKGTKILLYSNEG